MRSVVVALFAGLFTMPAVAPTRAATISGNYFEDTANINCSNVFNCIMLFPVLPSALTGKFLLLDTVSCNVAAPGNIVSAYTFVTDAGTNPRRNIYLTAPPPGTSSFSGHVGQKITGGPPRQIAVQVNTSVSGSIFVFCTMVGTIVSQ